MKRVFVWTIQHTGTFFAGYIISLGFPKDRRVYPFGSLAERHQKLGHLPTNSAPIRDFSDYCPTNDKKITAEWFDKYVVSLVTDHYSAIKDELYSNIDLENIDLFIAHEHHHRPGTQLLESLKKHKPDNVSFIIPMRDPLLSLHTKLWREYEVYKHPETATPKFREELATRWIKLYHDFLQLPKENIFLFPIDTPDLCNEKSRIKLCENAYKFCNISFGDTPKNAAIKWKLRNSTLVAAIDRNETSAPVWTEFKEAYKTRNIGYVKDRLGIEFSILQKSESLKKLLEQVGYRDLLWW